MAAKTSSTSRKAAKKTAAKARGNGRAARSSQAALIVVRQTVERPVRRHLQCCERREVDRLQWCRGK